MERDVMEQNTDAAEVAAPQPQPDDAEGSATSEVTEDEAVDVAETAAPQPQSEPEEAAEDAPPEADAQDAASAADAAADDVLDKDLEETPAAEAGETEETEEDGEDEFLDDSVMPPTERPGDWFVIHTYAGYENKVKANLMSRISSMNVEEKVFEVVIPMEDSYTWVQRADPAQHLH